MGIVRIHNLRLKASGVLAFLIGTAALYYGFAMTFLVPGAPGEAFFQKDRVLLGMLPLCAAVLTLCLAGWLLFHSASNPKRHLSDMIVYCIGGAIGAIWLSFIIGAIYKSAKGF
jgi:hypothetical protein